MDDLFAAAAKGKGKVASIKNNVITIAYDDPNIPDEAIQLGKRFGAYSGHNVPHEVVTDLKVGDDVKPGDIVSFNKGFFKRDSLEPSQVNWMPGVQSWVALVEDPSTIEDSSRISYRLSQKLNTKDTYIKTIYVNFNQEVRNLVQVGEKVDLESLLCYLEEPLNSQADALDDDSIGLLASLSKVAPKAKHNGVVDNIEIIYNGDTEDMSETLRKLVEDYDAKQGRLSKALKGEVPPSGRVGQTVRIEGNILEADMVAIRVYITEDISAGTGDKGVICHQMKTVFNGVMSEPTYALDGTEIDVFFGYKSVEARTVHSVFIVGTLANFATALTKAAVEAYFGKE